MIAPVNTDPTLTAFKALTGREFGLLTSVRKVDYLVLSDYLTTTEPVDKHQLSRW